VACIGMHDRGAGSSQSPQFSGVAFGENARLHPWQNAHSKCGNDEAGNVPQHRAQTPTESGACHKSQCEHASRGAQSKPNNKRVQRKCFEENARLFSRERKRQLMRATACNKCTAEMSPPSHFPCGSQWPVGRHLPKHADIRIPGAPRLRIYLSARQGLPARCFGRADARASSRQNARDLRCRSISSAG